MRVWLVPAVLLSLLVSGCADVDTDDASPAGASPTAAVRCEPAPDQMAFAVTYALTWPTAKLRRPFIVEADGAVLLAADTLTVKGEPRQKGAVWIAADRAGKDLSSLNAIARTESGLPDGRGKFEVKEDDPLVAQAQACIDNG